MEMEVHGLIVRAEEGKALGRGQREASTSERRSTPGQNEVCAIWLIVPERGFISVFVKAQSEHLVSVVIRIVEQGCIQIEDVSGCRSVVVD